MDAEKEEGEVRGSAISFIFECNKLLVCRSSVLE